MTETLWSLCGENRCLKFTSVIQRKLWNETLRCRERRLNYSVRTKIGLSFSLEIFLWTPKDSWLEHFFVIAGGRNKKSWLTRAGTCSLAPVLNQMLPTVLACDAISHRRVFASVRTWTVISGTKRVKRFISCQQKVSKTQSVKDFLFLVYLSH